MLAPTIHTNGTPRERLLDGACEVVANLTMTLRSMTENGPNGRDYYPQGDKAMRQATAEWQALADKVREVRKEILALSEAIADSE